MQSDQQKEGEFGVEALKYQLPMAYEYEEDKFYVRYCYPEYYRYIILALTTKKKYISLTGTPGIGKSIFYLYFFQRYRSENPDQTIVTASFSKARKLKSCSVFEPNKQERTGLKEIPSIEGALYLYDGPPDNDPGQKMICFTSPNYAWLDEMSKARNHLALYLPFWTLNELLEANYLLELGLEVEMIKHRFLMFGGSARHCLSQELQFVVKAYSALLLKAKSINSFAAIKELIEMKSDKAEVIHHIFHFVPEGFEPPPEFPERPPPELDHGFPEFFKLVFCSIHIAKIVDQNIRDKSNERRDELAIWLKGDRKCSTLLGWLFEGYANEVLKAGGEFVTPPLKNENEVLTFTLKKDDYQASPTDNYESIDGYCWKVDEKNLFLFQMTLNDNHPVKAEGIAKHIQGLGLDLNSIAVHLIFVVAKSMKNYKAQNIESSCVSNGTSSHVSVIPHIGSYRAEKLAAKGIYTIQDLSDANKSDSFLQMCSNFLDDFNKGILSPSTLTLIKDIPQYLLVLDADYK